MLYSCMLTPKCMSIYTYIYLYPYLYLYVYICIYTYTNTYIYIHFTPALPLALYVTAVILLS